MVAGNMLKYLNRRLVAFVHDVAMSAVAFLLAWSLRLGIDALQQPSDFILPLGVYTGISAVTIVLFGPQSGIWRYSSLTDLFAILRATTIAIMVFLVALFVLTRLEAFPRTVPFIIWFIQIILLGAPRLFYRMLRDGFFLGFFSAADPASCKPILLYGAGDEAETFIRALAKQKNAPYRIIGILDRRRKYVGRSIHNVRIIGTLDDLPDTLNSLKQRYPIAALVIAQPHLDKATVQDIVAKAAPHNIAVKRLPDLTRFQSGDARDLDLQAIRLEDLLGRDPVQLNISAIAGMIAGKSIMVTGAGGSIGSELTKQIAGFAPGKLILLDHSEYNLYAIDMAIAEQFPELKRVAVICSVRNRERVFQLTEQFKPEMIFHAAALKHVPLVEENPSEGVLTNVFGSCNVADAARSAKVNAVVMVSTDKAINPTNIMGATKRVAESYCQALDVSGAPDGTRFVTVRFGNVLGSTGSVVPLFEHQIKRGGPLTVTHPDVKRYFMTTREAVELILQATVYGLAHREDIGRIFVLDMGKPVKILDLAHQMIHLSGGTPGQDIDVVFTGLRPGEKLFEELFDVAEPPRPTSADGVLVATPRQTDLSVLERMLTQLRIAAGNADDEKVRSLIGQMVPEYQPAKRAEQPEQAAGAKIISLH